jgi:hypothetical protein
MTEAILVTQSANRPRQTKFTPETMQQIANLVERGKSRAEIAEIIGVTPATLQVMCSRLKISLRRPRYDLGTGMLRSRRKLPPNGKNVHQLNENATRRSSEQMEDRPQLESPSIVPPFKLGAGEDAKPPVPQFGVRMHYRGEDRTIDLPLSPEMVGRLAIEAEFRNVRIGELVGELVVGVVEKDMFQLVLARS